MSDLLLDRAYALHKQGTEAHCVASLASLATEFPGVSLDDIASAFDRAGSLIHTACEWAEQRRGPRNDGTGIPSIDLKEKCPGFSEGIYLDAESWGLYLTK